MVGHGEDELPDARPRHRAPQPRRAELPGRDQHRARLGTHRPRGLRLRDDHRPGQRPGRPRARPEVRPAPGRARPREPRAPRPRRRGVGRGAGRPAGARASTATRCSARSSRARSAACCRICFNPVVSLPDNAFVGRMLEKLEFYVGIDFFLSETRALRRRRAARLAARGGRGHRHDRRGTRHQDQQGGRLPRRGARGLADHPGHRPRPGPRPHGFTFASRRARSSTSCAWRRRAASPTTRASPTRRSSAQYGVFWPCPSEDHPGTPRLFEPGSWNPVAKGSGPFYFPDGKARFVRRPLRAARRGRGRRVPADPHHRPRGQPLPLRHADPAHRPARGPLPGALHRGPPAARRDSSGLADGRLGHRRDPARRAARCGSQVVKTIRPDTDLHPLPLAGREERQPAHHRGPGSDLEDPRVQGLRGAAARRRAGRAAARRRPLRPCPSPRPPSSSSTRAAASAATRASRPAPSATRTRATR